jgi:hypothetical protein
MNWIFVTDPYVEHSNGVQIMHRLADLANCMGESAYLVFMNWHDDARKRPLVLSDNPVLVSRDLNTPALTPDMLTPEFLADAVVVYPDALPGNPLEATRIVRYLGNRPGHCTRGVVVPFEPGEFLLAHSRIFVPNPDLVLFNAHIDPCFFADSAELSHERRSLDLVYHGKAVLYGQSPVFSNTLLVERQWPRGRQQLSLLLKQCRFFYTYDAWSNINSEAIAAGAVPVFMQYAPWTREEIDACEVGPFPCGKLVGERNGAVVAEVDYAAFLRDRETFLERMRTLEESWMGRAADAIERIRSHFAS